MLKMLFVVEFNFAPCSIMVNIIFIWGDVNVLLPKVLYVV